MEYEDKLVEFIDGELPEEEERELFSMISMDDSLRGEYKSLLAITNTIKASSGFYAPGTALKASVYRDLNISMPVRHTPAFAKLIQGSKWHFLSGGIGALLATSVFMVSTSFFSTENRQATPLKMNKPDAVQQIESPNDLIKSNMNNIITNKKHNVIISENLKKENIMSEPVPEQSNHNLLAMSEPIFIEKKSIKWNEPELSDNINLSDITEQKNELQLIQEEDFGSDEDIGISVEGRWSTNWNIPKETLQPARISDFNNLGFEIFFNVIDNFDFGINIRQETFFTKYEENVRDDIIYKIEQNPNLTSYGISFRQKFLTDKDLQPLGQINLAVNNYGIILRPSVGILYKINDSFSLVENLEYSNMLFTHNQRWFSASKIGLNFGINYKF
ncbi:MAG: hypothetical protein A2475_08800 [Ignavibacteria bacterium RIFOXYC2_FULL_35_21]|nr:MAG: hypothetical protein A2X63_00180 [Ignavibacteria bacterium GWA2_35_8]OGU93370.1 MAG: hypothetical protein A2220_13425 [Ignavibacteria bacterium RIFOXYA2_FULL_35_10]OGV18826.1 MAG: hypothetical protein A2475_08800 [Ignavibacteria bacterium RIFOXYC2_FULL_35_21]